MDNNTIIGNINEEFLIDESKLSEDSFQQLLSFLKDNLNFESFQYSPAFVKRRILVRMRATRTKLYGEYQAFLSKSEEEQAVLLKNLSINVTEFFRDVDFWQFCYENLFLKIMLKFKDKNTIRIWSAGCSTGQEATSILIAFLEIDPNLKNKIKIIGTDINEKIVERARAAEYGDFDTKGLSEEIMQKYFYKKDELLCLKDEYKSNLEFKKHDLLKDDSLTDIDVIFCRNTVIYFNKESKENLYVRFFESLKKPSFFVLGKTETLTGPARDLFKNYNVRERVFIKE